MSTTRNTGYALFQQLITEALIQHRRTAPDGGTAETAQMLAKLLWQFVSVDDQTIIDVTMLLVELRDKTERKELTRQEIVATCNNILDRIRNNPQDKANT